MELPVNIWHLTSALIIAAVLTVASATEDNHAGHKDHAQEAAGNHKDHEGDDDHEDHDGHDDHEDALRLSEQEREEYGIIISKIKAKVLSERVTSPGEVIVNAYASSRVSPRVAAQVIARHVKLGEDVKQGQVLVTLSSVDMAKAQGELLIASAEWLRVKELGRDAVSARRYTEAQVAKQQAVGKVTAFGMTKAQINRLMQSGDASKANGTFILLSPQNGTVINDDFIAGEQIEPGRVLFDISDESVLWIEAQITPQKNIQINEGAAARVSHNGSQWLQGKVIQVRHKLDETTRTQGIRIEVDNPNHLLHPGEFVETEIFSGNGPQVLAIPTSALTLLDEQQTVFKLEDGEFHAETIVTGATTGDWIEVSSGILAGDLIVTEGAFVLKSLLLKSQLGDGHVH